MIYIDEQLCDNPNYILYHFSTAIDLSFNRIAQVDGLSTLTQLTDLSLAHNRIVKLENMENLKLLDVLSIGGNLIVSQADQEPGEETVRYLRQFKNLRSLSLAGNPFCSSAGYEAFAIAYLPIRSVSY